MEKNSLGRDAVSWRVFRNLMTISLLHSFSEGQVEQSALKNSALFLLSESKQELMLLGFDK